MKISDFNDTGDRIKLPNHITKYRIDEINNTIYLNNKEMDGSSWVKGSRANVEDMREALGKYYIGKPQDYFVN